MTNQRDDRLRRALVGVAVAAAIAVAMVGAPPPGNVGDGAGDCVA